VEWEGDFWEGFWGAGVILYARWEASRRMGEDRALDTAEERAEEEKGVIISKLQLSTTGYLKARDLPWSRSRTNYNI
jgi:hypothetical protein